MLECCNTRHECPSLKQVRLFDSGSIAYHKTYQRDAVRQHFFIWSSIRVQLSSLVPLAVARAIQRQARSGISVNPCLYVAILTGSRRKQEPFKFR